MSSDERRDSCNYFSLLRRRLSPTLITASSEPVTASCISNKWWCTNNLPQNQEQYDKWHFKHVNCPSRATNSEPDEHVAECVKVKIDLGTWDILFFFHELDRDYVLLLKSSIVNQIQIRNGETPRICIIPEDVAGSSEEVAWLLNMASRSLWFIPICSIKFHEMSKFLDEMIMRTWRLGMSQYPYFTLFIDKIVDFF